MSVPARQAEIQKMYLSFLDQDQQYAAALKGQFKFDASVRKSLAKTNLESKFLTVGGKKVTLEVFQNMFEKEFIPEFSAKIFEIVYDYNSAHYGKNNKNSNDSNAKPQNSNFLAVENSGLADFAKLAIEEEKEESNEKPEDRVVTLLSMQRFIKDADHVKKHIRQKSVMPMSKVFANTEFKDISSNAGKATFEDFQKVFEKTLGKKQCKEAFDLMADENGLISLVAYTKFRDQGFRKLEGDALNAADAANADAQEEKTDE